MIISNITKSYEKEWVKIQAMISWADHGPKCLFFAVPKEYELDLDTTFADNFVVAMILLAAKYNENIYVKNAYVSTELIKNIEEHLLPSLEKMGCGNNKTRINSSLEGQEYQQRGNTAVSGISLGVDCFYAILSNMRNEQHPISALLYIHGGFEQHIIINQEVQMEIDKRREVAKQLGLAFIPILSNIDELLNNDFLFSNYHTYYHLAAALSLRSINCYYYATSQAEKNMTLDFHYAGHYDNIIRDSIKHNNFHMVCAGGDTIRFEKTRYICEHSVVKKYLDVCFPEYKRQSEFVNCGKCFKCIRTMTTLDVLGKLEEFGHVFNLDNYYNNKAKGWGVIEYRRIIMKKNLEKEVSEYAKKMNYHRPFLRWFYFTKIGLRNQKNKIVRIIKRGKAHKR